MWFQKKPVFRLQASSEMSECGTKQCLIVFYILGKRNQKKYSSGHVARFAPTNKQCIGGLHVRLWTPPILCQSNVFVWYCRWLLLMAAI
jgi:hypothetical protein